MWISKRNYSIMQDELRQLRYDLSQIQRRQVEGVMTTTWCLYDDPEQNPTIASFAMTYGDWSRLQETEIWKMVEDEIHRSQKEHSQMSLHDWVY